MTKQNSRPSAALTYLVWGLAVIGVFVAGCRAVGQYQVPGPFDQYHLGFCDFHNGVYFPTKAWLEGDNPYSQEYADSYPVMRQVPLYSPLVFIAHTPLALMPLNVAEGANFALSVALAIGCAFLIQRALIGPNPIAFAVGSLRIDPQSTLDRGFLVGVFSAMILYSRAGHTTLLSGYFSLELAFVTLLTLYCCHQRPWVASFALAYSSVKPTFAIPLGIMLVAMGRWPVFLRGFLIASLFAVAGIILMAAHAPANEDGTKASLVTQTANVVSTMLNTQEVHRAQNWSKPAISWTRLDLLSLIAKWADANPGELMHLIVMMLMLVPVCAIFWKASTLKLDDGPNGIFKALAITTMMVCLYRHAYDAVPLLSVFICSEFAQAKNWNQLGPWRRHVIAALTLFPLFNYSSSQTFLNYVADWPLVTKLLASANAIALFMAWSILLFSTGRIVFGNANPAPQAFPSTP